MYITIKNTAGKVLSKQNAFTAWGNIAIFVVYGIVLYEFVIYDVKC